MYVVCIILLHYIIKCAYLLFISYGWEDIGLSTTTCCLRMMRANAILYTINVPLYIYLYFILENKDRQRSGKNHRQKMRPRAVLLLDASWIEWSNNLLHYYIKISYVLQCCYIYSYEYVLLIYGEIYIRGMSHTTFSKMCISF